MPQIKAMGTRDKSGNVDFSGILEQEVEDALKAAAQISMGTEISEEDLSNIIALCDQVRALCACVRRVLRGLQDCRTRCACVPRKKGGKRDLRVPAQRAEVSLNCCCSPG